MKIIVKFFLQIFFLCILWNASLFGQDTIYTANYKSFEAYIDLSKDEEFILSERKDFALKAIDLANKLNNANKKIDAYSSYGYILAQEGKFTDVFKIYNKINKLTDSIGYHSKKDYIRKAYYLNIKGILYKEKGIYNKSLDAYYKSLSICDSIEWKQGQTIALNNISNLFFLKGDINSAIDLQRKSLIIAKETQDSNKVYDAYFNLMTMYSETEIKDSSFYFAEKAYKILPKFKSHYQNCYFYSSYATTLLNNNEQKKAYKYYNKCLNIAKINKFYELELRAYIGLSEINKQNNKLDIAKQYLLNALHISNNLHLPALKVNVLSKLSPLLEEQGVYKEALFYLNNAVSLNDSINKSWKNIQLSQTYQLYEIQLQNQQNKIVTQELLIANLKINNRNYLLTAFGFSSIFLLISLWYIIRKNRIEKELNKIAANNAKLVQEKDNQAKIQIEIQLKNDLKVKNRQLTTFSLSSIKHVNTTKDIILKISKIIYNEPIKQSTKAELSQVIEQMKRNLIKNDWKEFKTYYEQAHPSFYESLFYKHPDLTANEEKLCAFISLGLSTKDIASLTFRQLKSIDSARLRLRKKLNIDSDISIFDYLKQF